MTLEERLTQLESELNDLRAEKERPNRNRWWKQRHDHFRDELNIDVPRYERTIRTGISTLVRGTLDCNNMYVLSAEGKQMANDMMTDLEGVVRKYYQPKNNPAICHPCRSYER